MTNRFGLRNYDTWVERLIKLSLLIGAVTGFCLGSGRMLAAVITMKNKLDNIIPIVYAQEDINRTHDTQLLVISTKLDDLKREQHDGFTRLEKRLDRLRQ